MVEERAAAARKGRRGWGCVGGEVKVAGNGGEDGRRRDKIVEEKAMVTMSGGEGVAAW
jgi:hypothetical protein